MTWNETSYRSSVWRGSAIGPSFQSTIKPSAWALPFIPTPAPAHTLNFSRIRFSLISTGEAKSEPLIVILSVGPLAMTSSGTHTRKNTAIQAAFTAALLLRIIRLGLLHDYG